MQPGQHHFAGEVGAVGAGGQGGLVCIAADCNPNQAAACAKRPFDPRSLTLALMF